MLRRLKAGITHVFSYAWSYQLLLLYAIFLMYLPVVTHDYLMNDETTHIGLASFATFSAFVSYQFLSFSRSLFGVFLYAIYGFAGYSSFRVVLLRILLVAGFLHFALYMYSWLTRHSVNKTLAFFGTLYMFSLLPAQGIIAYSLNFLATIPAFWLSIGSFAYFFSASARKAPGIRSELIVYVLLLLAMQIQHTFAFVSFIPLTYLVLTDWPTVRYRALLYIGITTLTILFSIGIYALTLTLQHNSGTEGYVNGEEAVQTITDPQKLLMRSFLPVTYWTAFEFWTYPITTPYLGETKRSVALTVMSIWLLFMAYIVIREFTSSHAKSSVLAKWGTAVLCAGFGAMFLPVDNVVSTIGEHRPHIPLTLMGIIIMLTIYAIQSVAKIHPFFRRSAALKIAAAAFVLLMAFGAYRNVLDNIVLNRQSQLAFIKKKIMDAPNTSVTVVFPDTKPCIFEPCNLWMGSIPGMHIHMSAPGLYRYAFAAVGFNPDSITVRTVYSSDPIPKDSTIIDWNEYIRLQQDRLRR